MSPQKKEALEASKKSFISENAFVKNLKIGITDQKGNATHQLDGISIGHSLENPKNRKYTVIFLGLRDCYENHLESMKKLAQDTGTIVVSFNYRGTCESTGMPNSIKDYTADGKAIIEYLTHQEGADAKNILIHGHSLGGGIAAKTKQELNHLGPILSESSFSHFHRAVKDKKGAFTAWLIKKVGWNINSMKALKNVQNGHLGIIVNRRDYIINYKHVSLYHALKTKKPDKEFHTIKIGRPPSKESFELAVKTKTKNFKNCKVNKDSISKTAANSEYSQLQKRIKEAGWIQHLRNSHQMLIDQPKPNAIQVPKEIRTSSLASQLVKLNLLYAKEDELAYSAMVDMIKRMLQVT